MTIPEPAICKDCGGSDDLQYIQMDCCTWQWRCGPCRADSWRLTQAICGQLDQRTAEGRKRRLAAAA